MKIATLALAILLGTGAAAQAGSVDWSEYVDKNPSKPVPVARPTSAPAASDDAPAAAASKPARAGKKVAAKPKARAKAKRRH